MPGWAAWKARHPERDREVNRKVNARLYTCRRRFVWEYLLQHPCIDCGEKDPVVLEFDHVRGEKTKRIASVCQSYSIPKISEEIAKCEVRCANCHRRRHAKEQGFFRLLAMREPRE